ncbi:MAG TPA: N-acetylmuramoyl-L-alanine amidase [Longimicrobiales bacterium]|nr:N-acetylmuramoyl-L-alanine amidase [Longimicrobiales bacterium]
MAERLRRRAAAMCRAAGIVPRRHLTGAALMLAAATVFAVPRDAAAQQPFLRIGVAGEVIRGVEIEGTTAFPAASLESLGFRVSAGPGGTLAVLGADTLHFWNTSPFFRAGTSVHQLAFATHERDGAIWLPEQFFIQWLPVTFPDRFQYRGGVLLTVGGGSISTVASAAPAASTRSAAAPEREKPAPRRDEPAPRARSPRVVVIDPGHGGRDPGKIGTNGLREKDVTLLVSQRLAAVLEERGYEVHLTRTKDEYISLYDRPKLANEWKGDRPVAVFLSIHANSAPPASARGFETFFLSDARTDDERRVAEMENESIRFDEHGPSAPDAGLDQILSTLRSDFLMRASHDLASVVQQRMGDFHPGPNRGVKRAGFVVLVGTVMPAVLIETGFLSNRDDARLLGTQSFQQKLAWGIADSVDEFFARNEHLWESGR